MATKSSPHIAIVGGGISGISAALNLYKKVTCIKTMLRCFKIVFLNCGRRV